MFGSVAHAQTKRVAIVIGNAEYKNERPLRNPVNDAALIARTLRENLGFTKVIERANLDRRALVDVVDQIVSEGAGADAIVVYYSGHGMQGGDGSYLLPVDAVITDPNHVRREGVAARELIDALNRANARVALLVLDACRDNPFSTRTKSSTKGLAPPGNVTGGLLVAYATRDGATADDGTGMNSPYAQSLANNLKQTNLPLLAVLDRVAREVRTATSNVQAPTRYGDLPVDVFLVNTPSGGAPSPSPITLLPAPGTTTGLSLDDLQKQDSLKRQWADWQKQMKADYDKVVSFAAGGGSAELEAKAWERFLATWQQDNPTSQEDKTLRELAKQKMRVANLKVEEDATAKLRREQELKAQQEAAARQAEEERRRVAQAGSRPQIGSVKFIIPANPGGGWDVIGRSLGASMVKANVIQGVQYENKGGAGGTIGLAQFVNTSKGDGNAIMVGGMVMVGGIILNKSAVNLGMVTPLARLTGEYGVLVVPASSSIKSMKDLVTQLKANPGSVTWGGGSAGGTDHILAGMIAQAVGIEPSKINYIPYAGGGEAQAAILGGHVTVGVSGYSEFAGQIKEGKFRALAISSGKKIAGIDVPTLKDQGIDVELTNWRGVFGAPGITDAQKKALIASVETTVKSSAWKEVLTKQDWTDLYLAGDAFEKFVDAQNASIGAVLGKLVMRR
jgi:putative tricarboxylic transport membrane protein